MGDFVAIASYSYPFYRNILGALGCKMASIPIDEEFKLTATELRHEIARGRDSSKGLVLLSLSNPTGSMLNPDKLKELCELCKAENIQSLSDEIRGNRPPILIQGVDNQQLFQILFK
jgi:aspartate/methionine/tyrosine aminotransferase